MTQGKAQESPAPSLPETADLARDVFDREQDEHLDAEALKDALAALLELYPEAPVAALRADSIMVDMPDSVPLKRNPVLKARWVWT